jgi:aspartokinase
MSQGIHVTGAQHGSLAKLISVIDDTFFTITGSRIDMMFTQQSSEASSLVFVVPTNAGIEAIDRLCGQIEEAIIGLPHATVWDVNAVQILTLVGNGIGQNPSLLATTLQLVNDLPLLASNMAYQWIVFRSSCPMNSVMRLCTAYIVTLPNNLNSGQGTDQAPKW